MDEYAVEDYSVVVCAPMVNHSSKGHRKLVGEIMIEADVAERKRRTLFARFGDGRWYAILPEMEAGLRKAGAEVSVMPSADAETDIEVSGTELVRPSSSCPAEVC